MELKINKNIEINNLGNDTHNPFREYLAIDDDGNLWLANEGQGSSNPVQLTEDVVLEYYNDEQVLKMIESAKDAGWDDAIDWLEEMYSKVLKKESEEDQ